MLFRKRYYVGDLTRDIYISRFFHPPLSSDWEGCYGTFDSSQEAEDFKKEIEDL